MLQKKLLIIIIFIALSILAIHANRIDFRFTHLTNVDGISQQHITCLMQDSKGFMWIGTKNGLCLYNGYEIKRYFNIDKNENSLNHNFIRAVFQDDKNQIWIGTDRGLCRYLPEFDIFQRYDYPQASTTVFSQTLSGDLFCVSGNNSLNHYNSNKDIFERVDFIDDAIQIFSMTVDKADKLWIGSTSGIKIYDRNLMQITEYANLNRYESWSIVEDIPNTIFIDKQENIWIGKNGNGLVRFNPKTQQIKHWDKQNGLNDGMVRTIEEDAQGRIWVGTEKGLFVFFDDENIINIQQDYTNNESLNDNAIYCVLSDRDDNIWVGTYFGGINILKNDYKQFKHYRAGYSNYLLKGKAIRKIIEENEDMLWIATEDGGLNRLNEKTGEIKKITHPAIVDNVHSLLLDKQSNTLWIGMFRGGITKLNIKTGAYKNYPEGALGLNSDMVFSIEEDKDGVIWIASARGLRYYDKQKDYFERLPHETLSNYFIYTLFVDSENQIWIGTRSQGLFRYNKISGEIKSWVSNESINGLKDNFITSIFEDSNKQIWIGTNNGGLYYIDRQTETIYKADYEPLRQENCIYGTLEDENKNMWFSTNNGLICMDVSRKNFYRYTTDEGLPTNQFNYSSCLKSTNGRFYFGTVNGMISFIPKEVAINNDNLNIALINLYIDNQAVTALQKNSPLTKSFDETDKIILSAKQARSFSIEYAAIALGHTSNISYSIKMEGVDREWNYVDKQRRIIYSNLPHGHYVFKIRASSSNQEWDKASERSLEVEILPPFYLSAYAYTIYFVIIVLILFVAYKIVSIRIKEKNQMKMEHLEKESIKAMNKMKIDFFTNISHELKTPLTLIISPLQSVLESSKLDFGLKPRLQTVSRNARKMVKLLEELLTFNKIEAGQTTISLQKGNPMEFLEEIYYLFKEITDKKEIHFELDLENNEELVWYSPSCVEKVINNLLSNAIKFTPEKGQIKLSANIEEGVDGFIKLNVAVADTGIGIVKEELTNIFTNYYQTPRGRNFDSVGWGIGLALTYNLVNLHKGNISVESEVGKGTTFSVIFNVDEKAFSKQEISDIKADQNFLVTYNYQKSDILENTILPVNKLSEAEAEFDSQYTILVVDDNQELAGFLSEIFSAKYYKVFVASDGEEALKIATKHFPDIIISDIMMPVMDGITLCNRLKNDLLISHIPVILLTAKQGQENMITGFESGADMYIEKPFNTKALELMVQNMLRTRDLNRKQFKDNPEISFNNIIKNPRDEKLLSNIKEFIKENIDNENLSVADITQAVGVSRTVLHVKMKNLLDMSISEYVKTLRLNKAKELLLEGMNISETAYNTGFSDPNYFSKCFKKKFNTTPSDFLSNLKS